MGYTHADIKKTYIAPDVKSPDSSAPAGAIYSSPRREPWDYDKNNNINKKTSPGRGDIIFQG